MTAFVLPDVDRSTIDELMKRSPEPEGDRASEDGARRPDAEKAVDRLLGRSRAPVWPWVAAGIGLVALVGAIGAYFAWFRRPTWEDSTADPSMTSDHGRRVPTGGTATRLRIDGVRDRDAVAVRDGLEEA